MKININTNNIRIYKLLKFSSYKNIDFICQFLKMNKQNVILYIKQIYFFINATNSKVNVTDMVNEIINDNTILKKLKSKQNFIKENRIFYITLRLLCDRNNVNLTQLSTSLNVSRRILNDDLIYIKKDLSNYNLTVSSSTTGINIFGNEDDIKSTLLAYVFKFLIELDELPTFALKDYTNYFNNKKYKNLDYEISTFIYRFGFDMFANNNNLLKAFHFSFTTTVSEDEPRIRSLDFKIFKHSFSKIFKADDCSEIYNFFKVTSLGDIPVKDIDLLITTFKFLNGTLESTDINLKNEIDSLEPIFLKNIDITLKNNPILIKFINKISLANYRTLFLQVFDLTFLNFSLTEDLKIKCINLFLELKNLYPHIQFSNVIFLYLWILNEKQIIESKNAIVVFNKIPNFLFPIIRNKFLINENINILHFVSHYDIDKFLLDGNKYQYITFENLNLCEKYNFIKKHKIPI